MQLYRIQKLHKPVLMMFLGCILCNIIFAAGSQQPPKPMTVNGEDYMMDTPWIIYKDDTIPFMWMMKDECFENLHAIGIYDISNNTRYYNGDYTPKADRDFWGNFNCPPIEPNPIGNPNQLPNQIYYHQFCPSHLYLGNNNFWYYYTETFENDGYLGGIKANGTPLTPANIGYGPGEVITLRAIMLKDDDYETADFRIIVSGDPDPLPKLPKWFLTDMHYHTWNTDNPYEYGGPTGPAAKAARAVGLDCIIITDHSGDVNDNNNWEDSWGYGLTWNHMSWEVDHYNEFYNDFKIIRGEEIAANVSWIWPWEERHIITFGLTSMIESENWWDNLTYPLSIEEVFNQIEAQQGAFAYWAHPPVGEHTNLYYLLSRSGFRGLEFINTRKTHTTNRTSQHGENHPWGDDNPSLGVWENEKPEWDEEITSWFPMYDDFLSLLLTDPYTLKIKFFIGGGSDAHGAFNYNIEWENFVPIQDRYAVDGPVGCWRTAVNCPSGLSQDNILLGLKNGRSVVTDGPLMIFGIDQNHDGDINDPQDIIIGDGDDDENGLLDSRVIVGPDVSHKIYFEWKSNQAFGEVGMIELWMGTPATGQSPIEIFQFIPSNYEGTSTWFDLGNITYNQPNPIYLRAVAYSSTGSGVGQTYRCFTNPIWLNWEPRKPTNVRTEYVHEDQLKLCWDLTHSSTNSFTIKRSNFPQGPYYSIKTVGGTVRSCTLMIAEGDRGKSFYYKIYRPSPGIYSESLKVTIPLMTPPSGLTASSPTTSSSYIQWCDNTQYEAYYEIARRADEGSWQNGYATVPTNNTSYDDTVTLLHTYAYRVRAVDGNDQTSAWSNEDTVVVGKLSCADNQTITAYNNGPRVAINGDNVHIVSLETTWDGTKIYRYSSTDGGVSFGQSRIAYTADPDLTCPSISLGPDGSTYIVWGQYQQVYTRGDLVPGWHILYNVMKNEEPHSVVDIVLDANPYHSAPDRVKYLVPPSFVVSQDSGYIAFQFLDDTSRVCVASFQLSTLENHNFSKIPYTWYPLQGYPTFPVIGFDDNGNPNRTVVLRNDLNNGCLEYSYRQQGSGTWHGPMYLPDFYTETTPSMIVDNNEIVIAIDGDYSAIRGIHTAHLSWSGEYVVDQIQTVTERNENYNFCYLSAKDIVLWSNAGDIFYSMKYGTEWQTPENISNSIGNSQFPNGINYYSGFLNRKLFLVWTEAANNQFYLVRHSFNLPEGVPPGGALGKDQKLENKFWFKVAGSNPIVRKTNIQFNTPLEQMVVIKLYDVTGRLVSDIYNQRAARGITSVALPVDNLSNGIYFLRVTTPSENYVEKLVITR